MKSLKPYFSHDLNSRNDRKLVKLFKQYKLAGLGAYWCIVEMLHEEGGYIPLTEIKNIAFELRVKEEFILKVLNGFELFSSDSEKFWCESALKRLKQKMEKSVKARESVNNRWNNDTNVIREETKRNTLKESKVNKRKVKETKVKLGEASSPDSLHVLCRDIFFEVGKAKNKDTDWDGRKGKSLNSIISKLQKRIQEKNNLPARESEVCDGFRHVLENMDTFFAEGFDINTIDAKFDTIINKIKENGRSKKGQFTGYSDAELLESARKFTQGR